jgi:hypothetical protein
MKNIVYGVVFVVVTFFCASTAWAQKAYKPSNSNDNIIGSVQTIFETRIGYGSGTSDVNQAAYIALLGAAKKEYQGNIDVRDITWVRGRSIEGAGMYEFSGNGKVILLGGSGGSAAKGVEGALERAANDVSKDFNNNARIAIVQISAPDRSTRDYIIGELEYILQQQGYYMVDRAQLDKIFDEQRFGATSDVDDNTAARMGKISGASIVITGRVDGEGNLRRLRLRALNTETARVVGVASERL